jgi:hypothetical protein
VRLPCEAGTIGAAWLSTVIHHLPDLDACAGELARVLAPDAPILLRSFFPGRTQVALFRFFPAAGRVANSFPTLEAATESFARAGFVRAALVSVPQVSAPSLRAALARVALRADTTLKGIPDEDFAAGLEAMKRAVEGERTPSPVIDRLDLAAFVRAERRLL